MRAIGIKRFGDAPVLMERPVPEPGSGQVQVAIEAAATNPLDMAVASGALVALGVFQFRFPLTLGMDGVGTVTATGDGVTEFHVGQRVFGQFWSQPQQFGTFAEVCVAQAAPAFGALAAVPDEMPSHVAAALPTSGMTALGAIDDMQVPVGGTLLVNGATGGVGTFAVQAAASHGIPVIATAPALLAEQVRALGADEIVVRGKEPLEQAVRRIAPEGVDAILDVVGDSSLNGRLAGVVKRGGVLFSTAFGIDAELLDDERIRTANYRLDRKSERLAELAKLVTADVIRPIIGATVSLEETPRALSGGAATGLRGKTVLKV